MYNVSRSHVDAITAGASNIRGGQNPPFTVDDFKVLYPQFWERTPAIYTPDPGAEPDGIAPDPSTLPEEPLAETPYVPIEVIEMYVEFAHACVNIARYRNAWKLCMGLFIAHFLSLYMQTLVDPDNASAQAVTAAGQTKGLMSQKSVDQVSASYDFSHVMQDLNGWAAWKLTAFGVQFATLAKAYGMGGMRVT